MYDQQPLPFLTNGSVKGRSSAGYIENEGRIYGIVIENDLKERKMESIQSKREEWNNL